ncbi:MAG: peptidylprolyl isomerase [Acidimicrobiales bacterium]
MGTVKRDRQKQYRQQRLAAARAAQQRRKRRRSVTVVAIGLVLLFIAVFVFSQQIDDDDGATASTTSSSIPAGEFVYGSGPCPAADGSSPQTLTFEDAPQQCIDAANTYTALFDTSEGAVRVELDTATTPGTTNNFVTLARYHFYDGTQFFRTDPSIGIIQGGAPTNTAGDPGPGYTIPDEGGAFDFTDPNAPTGPFTYTAGDLVMARSSGPNTSGAQIFFAAGDAVSGLDSQGVYLKFGRVTEGLDVLQAILALHQEDTTGQVLGGFPSRTVTVNTVTIEETPAAG